MKQERRQGKDAKELADPTDFDGGEEAGAGACVAMVGRGGKGRRGGREGGRGGGGVRQRFTKRGMSGIIFFIETAMEGGKEKRGEDKEAQTSTHPRKRLMAIMPSVGRKSSRSVSGFMSPV